MSDKATLTKGRIVFLLIFWFGILFLGVAGFKWFWKPRQEQIAEEEAEQQEQEVLDKTSSRSRYKYEIDFRADAFSGYAAFRSNIFKQECAKYGVKINMEDDMANYANRLNALATGKCQMAVFTIDALVKASSQLGEVPATVVCLIDETKGADAMVGAGKKFPNLDSLNDSGVKIVCTPDSPSETLARVVMAYFNLDQLGPQSFEFADGAGAVYEVYKKSSPTDNKVFVLWEPYVSQMLENTEYQVVVDSSKFRGYIVDVIVVQRDYLLKNELVVEKVVKAYLTTVFQSRNDMVTLVTEDAKQLGEPLKPEQADRLSKTIWWKNTQENYGHYGFTTGHSLQHMEEICGNIVDVLLKTNAITQDPTDGQPNRLYYDGVVRKLFDTSWHPGFGQESVREEKTLQALSDDEWASLAPVGTLSIPRLVFARGTSRMSPLCNSILDDLVEKLKTWPQYYLIVRGNTSAKGDVEANRKLAAARAEAAVDYLVQKGVSRNRIHADTSKPNGSTTVAFILGEVPY
jgi:outer membrane protein OmpA-like peptidoglycan-associated protein